MTTDAVEAIRRKLILALDFPYVQEAIGMIHKVRPGCTIKWVWNCGHLPGRPVPLL